MQVYQMMMQGGGDSWNMIRRMRARGEQMCYQEILGASSMSKGGLVVAWLCDQPDS